MADEQPSSVDMKLLQRRIKLDEGFRWHDHSPIWGPYSYTSADGGTESRLGWIFIVEEADAPEGEAPLCASTVVTQRAENEWDFDVHDDETIKLRIDLAQDAIRERRKESDA